MKRNAMKISFKLIFEPFHRNVNLSLKKLMLSSRLKFGIVLKVVENAIQNEFKF